MPAEAALVSSAAPIALVAAEAASEIVAVVILATPAEARAAMAVLLAARVPAAHPAVAASAALRDIAPAIRRLVAIVRAGAATREPLVAALPAALIAAVPAVLIASPRARVPVVAVMHLVHLTCISSSKLPDVFQNNTSPKSAGEHAACRRRHARRGGLRPRKGTNAGAVN
jgi:hypothetical protein